MWSRFLAAVVLGAALVSSALADSFSANTTISLTNASNQTTDSFFVGNASVITAASFNTNFSRFSDFSTERQGFLYRNNADWNSGTRNNMTAVNNNLTVNASVDDLTSALWHMDGNGTDATSNGNLLAATGTANFTGVAKFGSASLWTSANSNGSVKNSSDVSPPGALFTFEGWFRAISFANPGGACFGGPYLWSRYNGVGQSYILVRIDTTGAFNFVSIATDSMGTVGFAPTASMSLNTWHHIAVTYNGSYLSFWFDGNEQGNLSVSGNMLWDNGDGRNLSLGSCASSTDNAFGGYIDEFRISRVQRYGADGSKTYTVPTSPFSAAPPTNASWESPVQDAGTLPLGQSGQRYSTIRYNLTVHGSTSNGTINFRASDINPPSGAWTVVREFNSTSNSSCPCSTGTNLSGVTGRYSQIRYNITTGGEANSVSLNNTQIILTNIDTGTLRLNSADYGFIQGNVVTVVPATFQSGLNTLRVTANNTSFYNLNLSYTAGNGLLTTTSANNCYTWKNSTTFADVTNITLTYSIHTGSRVWNSSVYLNGTLLTSNRSNASLFNYTAWNDSTTIYVQYNNTTFNGSTLNALVDQLCLNATAVDETSGGAISSFTVNDTTCAGGISKSTTNGFLWFNGTELCSGGTAASIFRVGATGYAERDFTLDLVSQSLNRTFTLLSAGSGAYITFHIQSGVGGAIANANVVVTVTLTGALVGTGLTDSSGSIRFFLNPSTSYTITTTATGFVTNTFVITPTNTEYTIVLSPSTSNLTTGQANTSTSLLPDALYNRSSQNITWQVFSPSPGGVVACRLEVWTNNTSINDSGIWRNHSITTSGCTARGGNLTFNLNLSNASNREPVGVLAYVDYYTDDGSIIRTVANRTYNVTMEFFGAGNFSQFSIPGILRAFSVSGVSGAFQALFSVLFSSVITIFVASRLNIGQFGVGFIMTGLLSVFAASGLFPVGIPILMGILVGTIYFFRRL